MLIKSFIADEVDSNGETPKILIFLSYLDLQLWVLTMDYIIEIEYFGCKDIDYMLKEGLIKKLVIGGDLIEWKYILLILNNCNFLIFIGE